MHKMIPPPGRYEVQKSYDMSQVKHNYMPPRSLVAKMKHSSFLSGTPRCLGKIDDGPAIASVIGYLPQPNNKTVLLKSPQAYAFGNGEPELVLNRKLHPY
ncbi:hypothetical protein STEG23_009732 [Scotinomys teguina]